MRFLHFPPGNRERDSFFPPTVTVDEKNVTILVTTGRLATQIHMHKPARAAGAALSSKR